MAELVSVIVPVYNGEQYLEKCILSIRRQSYTSFEIILVDDGSTDNTPGICAECAAADDRIVLLSQENQGVVSARQRGIEKAKGKYIAFTDADDWLEPDMLEILVNGIGAADMASVGVFWEERRGSFTRRRDLFPEGVYDRERLLELFGKMLYDSETGMTHSLTCWMVNKLFLADKVREIHRRLPTTLTVLEDAAFVFQYALTCKSIVLLDRFLYHYRYREDSASHQEDRKALERLGHTYAYLMKALERAPKKYGLTGQLKAWLIEKCYFTINERMGMPKERRMLRFLLDTEDLAGKKLVLYGAGRCGRDVRCQLESTSVRIVLWVDRRAEECRREGLAVDPPEAIGDADYDLVLVAIEDPGLAKSIVGFLAEMGIGMEKVRMAKVRRAF